MQVYNRTIQCGQLPTIGDPMAGFRLIATEKPVGKVRGGRRGAIKDLDWSNLCMSRQARPIVSM
jgi:hypothetical protein